MGEGATRVRAGVNESVMMGASLPSPAPGAHVPARPARWHPRGVTNTPDEEQAAVPTTATRGRSRRVGQSRDEVIGAARREADKVLTQFPAGTPARITRTFAHLLDELFRIPGTQLRFGLDPLLSLIPAGGTVVGAAFGTVVLIDAVRLRAPVGVLTRMVGNYLADWAVGAIPVVGPLFDMAYRSNAKNLKLLNRTIADREEVRRASARYWLGVAGLAAVVVLALLAIPVALLWWLGSALAGG